MKAHGDVSRGGIFKIGKPEWESRAYKPLDPYKYSGRKCSYCGSIHPLEAVVLIETGAEIHCADMKYGWPHKFYLDAPNEVAGERVEIGGRYDANGFTPHYEPAPKTQQLKLYSEHFLDLDDDELKRVSDVILAKTGIEFVREADTGRLKWRIVRSQAP